MSFEVRTRRLLISFDWIFKVARMARSMYKAIGSHIQRWKDSISSFSPFFQCGCVRRFLKVPVNFTFFQFFVVLLKIRLTSEYFWCLWYYLSMTLSIWIMFENFKKVLFKPVNDEKINYKSSIKYWIYWLKCSLKNSNYGWIDESVFPPN